MTRRNSGGPRPRTSRGGYDLVAMSDCLLDMAIPSGLVGM